MRQDVKERWVDALRSGEYRQARAALHTTNENGDAFCCLGVLCEVVKDDIGLEMTLVDEGEYYKYDEDGGWLPKRVVEYAELKSANPSVTFQGVSRSLSGLNDSGTSFEGIATAIEESL